MDKIEAYTQEHYLDIVQWFQDRKMIAPSRYDLPLVGYVMPGVGAGFLISTDTKTAIIDYMITNKHAAPILRGRALDRIPKALINRAKKLGFSSVLCDSQLDTIKRKAISLGFKDMGAFQVFSKEI